MKQFIKSTFELQKFIGLKSSEDIFWITFGYCLASKNKNRNSDIYFVTTFIEFIHKKYPQSFQHYNWGILLRLYSCDDKNSILKFEEEFNLFLLEPIHSFNENSLTQKLNIYHQRGVTLLTILDESCSSLNSLLELQMLLLGYIESCRINKVNDTSLSLYLENKYLYEKAILKEQKIPENQNCLRILHASFYSSQEALQYYRDKMTYFITRDIKRYKYKAPI